MTGTNTHTVIGLFDDRADAQAAMENLVRSGFTRENIDLSNNSAGRESMSEGRSPADDGSIGDRISNFFSSMFGDDSIETRQYSDVASDMEAILAVQTDSRERAEQAAQILDQNNAADVQDRSARLESGGTDGSAQETRTIPVIEEELQVGKRTVESGGVHVRSRIVERPVEETVRLRDETITVDRRPVDRAVSEGEMANFQEVDFELVERDEEAVIGKQARVTEEVAVGKDVTERDQVVKDKVRHTEVDVEKIDQDTRRKGKTTN